MIYNPNATIDEVIEITSKFHRVFSRESISKAYTYAYSLHKNTNRVSGEPYITHPLRVARLIASWGFESDVIVASLLHDVLEDCKDKGVTYESLQQMFGTTVANMVEAVSSLDKADHPNLSKVEIDVLSDLKLQRLMTTKALFIKAADRIDNLSSISAMPENKQVMKVDHTYSIILPMLHDIGANYIADKLEALCFEIASPEQYKKVASFCNDITSINMNKHTDNFHFFKKCFSQAPNELTSKFGLDTYCHYIKKLKYTPCSEVDVYRAFSSKTDNISDDINKFISKKNIPFYDFTLILDDSFIRYGENKSAHDFFLIYYQSILQPRGYCITDIGSTDIGKRNYFVLMDDCHNMYRFFVETQSEYDRYCLGEGIELSNSRLYSDIDDDPDDTYKKKIHFFKRNGDKDYIEEGATVLDVAFLIHTEVGVHFDYAKVNKLNTKRELFTKVHEGDTIEIITSENVTAKLNWFNQLSTKKARRKFVHYCNNKEKLSQVISNQ